MEILDQYHQIAAVFLARIFLGLLFFFQGYDAVFKVKIKNVILTFQNDFSNKGIPKLFTVWAAWFTCCSALVGGALLILGLFEYIALYLLGINILITSIGFAINTAMWDTRFVLPRLVLIVFLLVIPQAWRSWSLDDMFFPVCSCLK